MSPHEIPGVPVELAGVRRRLEGTTGRRYWKSLEELADSPGFLEFLHREFPEQASTFEDPKGRREFLTLMSASLALAGLTACTRQPAEKILPYVKQPEELVPGRPLFFATAVAHDGYARGVLVESHEGRPTKIEGNPDHPVSRGATDVFGQAHVLGLYDPDRSQTVKFYGEVRTWIQFRTALREALAKQKGKQGAGLRFLTGTVTSPTLAAQLAAVLAEFPAAKWHHYEPAGRDQARAGAILAFGEPVEAQYRFDQADVILSLEADFVGSGPASLRLIREFARRRKVSDDRPVMNRLYVVEGSPTLTGAVADHRLALKSSEIEGFARAVAAGLGLPVEGGAGAHADWVSPLVQDLQSKGPLALVIAGESQPPAVHALAHAINEKLGAAGQTVLYTEPVEAAGEDQAASLEALVAEMRAGQVEALVVLGVNVAYVAPADLKVAEALDQVPLRIHLGLYEDETAERCHWHLPEAHPLETWSDARAADGTVTIVQPLIAPLYGGISAHELLGGFLGRADTKGYDIVREHWKGRWPAADFEKQWKRALHDGVVKDTALPAKAVSVTMGDWAKAAPKPAGAGLEIVFRPDPAVFDGRFANNGWLQELPRPLTKLTWDNAAIIGPGTAQRLGFSIEMTATGHRTEVVEIRYRGRSVRAPVWVLPGHPDESVTVHLGLGRTRAGRVGTGVGFNAYALRTSDAPWFGAGAEIVRTGETTKLACTQDHWSIDQTAHKEAGRRHLVRAATLEEFAKEPGLFREMGEEPEPGLSLYPPHKYEGHAWGMAIDLNSCVGCNACVTACVSENNIPVVGKDQVSRGREMHWIRVDRYYEGPAESPQTFHQPVLCMHCENAPCEVVCPVTATVHSEEGLNDMVYNRCVGTRYCSNNCPYKVRRFNFFLYQDWTTPTFKMMRNPEVTVRSRGVMEKCTYCVQRISRARIDARNEGRPIREGEIQTACQQACPAEAIVFGDVNDPGSPVAQLKKSPRNYGLLAELQTRPRTTYLAAVRNPNPEMPEGRSQTSSSISSPLRGGG
jgi:molybdopterin-containing oxidoreductase family iron-sulfur binding subunit